MNPATGKRPKGVTLLALAGAIAITSGVLGGCEATKDSSDEKLEALSLHSDLAREAGRQAEERRRAASGGGGGGGGNGGGSAH